MTTGVVFGAVFLGLLVALTILGMICDYKIKKLDERREARWKEMGLGKPPWRS